MSNQMIEPGSLRCKDGDIALVIHDTPGCEQNLGKVFCGKGPAETIIRNGSQGWRIKPLHPESRVIEDERCRAALALVDWDSAFCHEDTWLLPLHPQNPDSVWWAVQQKIDQYLIECGQVDEEISHGFK